MFQSPSNGAENTEVTQSQRTEVPRAAKVSVLRINSNGVASLVAIVFLNGLVAYAMTSARANSPDQTLFVAADLVTG